MKIKLLLFFFFLTSVLHAQVYKISLIPDSLKANAHAVKRFEELRVEIKGLDKAVVKHHYAITILNEKGDGFAYYLNDYTSLVSLTDVTGKLYDADGKLIRSIKKRDISDMSASDDETLLSDRRVKRYSFANKTYPYTVEFEDEQDYNGIYYLPDWQPYDDERLSVQQSRFVVETPLDYKLRTKEFNYDAKPIVTENKTRIYVWEAQNKKALRFEPFQPALRDLIPIVYIAPTEFSIASNKGSMASWLDFGKFIYELNKNRDVLPDNVKQDVHKIADGLSNRTDKAKALYKYLQEHTRYISIQLGIGSWQPFEAKYVAEKKYGDCKALSNYMVSLLKEAGVKANYVLITAGKGREGLIEDFPSPYFNHVVCCVPGEKDTLWLECTSQTEAPGFMGSFTGDRKALLIAEDGGHVVNTPVYLAKDNRQLRKITSNVDAEGNLDCEILTRFSGIRQELQHSLIHDNNKEERQKYLNQALSLATYTVDRSDYKETPGPNPSIDENLHVKVPNYATVSGKRMFIIPNLVNRLATKLTDEDERKYPIRFSQAYIETDTILMSIPTGYTLESLPQNVSIDNRFGSLSVKYKIEKNQITVFRYELGNKDIFPSTDYPALVKYFDAMYKADHARLVFVKKDE